MPPVANKRLTLESTAYGPPWGGINGGGITATGIDLRDNKQKYGIAVDPSVIPLGSKLKITPNPFGYSGEFIAFDTGGAIKGNKIDFYIAENPLKWGRKTVKGTITEVGTGKVSASNVPSGTPLLDLNPLPDIPNPLDGLQLVANAIQQVAGAIASLVETTNRLIGKAFSFDTWLDLGKIFIGLTLIYIGLKRIFYIAS